MKKLILGGLIIELIMMAIMLLLILMQQPIPDLFAFIFEVGVVVTVLSSIFYKSTMKK